MRPNLMLVPTLIVIWLGYVSALPGEELAPESQLPDLFKFRHFTEHFRKKYSSRLEETARKFYFYASAFQVYVAGLAYKSRLSDHYLALNQLSDLSPQEWELMQNRQLVEDVAAAVDDETDRSSARVNPASLAKGFDIEEKLHESGVKSRRKRSTSPRGGQKQAPRQVSLDLLIQQAEPLVEPAHDVLAKPINLMEQQVPVSIWEIPVVELENEEGHTREANSASVAGRLFDALSGFRRNLGNLLGGPEDRDRDELGGGGGEREEATKQPPDAMFLDLRTSGCMLPPKSQSTCGSCYAFVAITLAEWLYCRSRRKLVSFSEQYIVDCGNDHVSGLSGCSGGRIDKAAHFIHNFGLELTEHYPYKMRDSECPYDNKTALNEAGLIRMNLFHMVSIPVIYWAKLLANTPLGVGVATPSDFRQYGGGVDSGERCGDRQTHGMVVVGHGRQDGQEFWLLRNSYGPQWGEGGYWKLAKSAPERCLWKQKGYAIGTSNAQQFKHEIKMNELNRRAQQVLSEALELGPSELV